MSRNSEIFCIINITTFCLVNIFNISVNLSKRKYKFLNLGQKLPYLDIFRLTFIKNYGKNKKSINLEPKLPYLGALGGNF